MVDPDEVLNQEDQAALEALFRDHGYEDYRWLDPRQIVVAHWVRMKCMFGCPNYGRKAACPPQTPAVDECRRFFREYQTAVVFHLRVRFDDPQDRFDWSRKVTLDLAGLERRVFLAGFERAFFLLLGGCALCRECQGERALCRQPELARPSPEAMAVDVYSTVRRLGYPIAVRTDLSQAMDRYLFLMVD